MTITQQILLNVLTILSGINGASPYLIKVDSVSDYDIAPYETFSDDVMLGVFPQSYNLPRGLTRLTHAQDVNASMVIGIRGIVRGDKESMGAQKRALMDDIGRALYSNINLQILTNAVKHEGLSFNQIGETPSGNSALGYFLGNLNVTFLLDPSNPEV